MWADRAMPEPNTGCLLWAGAATPAGYGKVTIVGKQVYTHRLAYETKNGRIPEGLYVCHRCDTPACINPDHLFLGTAADNLRDMVSKGRAVFPKRQSHCARGHALDGGNVIRRGKDRGCRTCFNVAKRSWRARRKAA